MLQYNQILWGKFKNKIESRQETINLFRELFNKESIDEDSEYWSICGQQTELNNVMENSEFNQLINENIIKPHQFHGVDFDKKIISENKRLIKDANFYKGSFEDVFVYKSIKPEIINIDTINYPEKAIKLCGNILNSIKDCNHNCLISLNFVSKKIRLNKNYTENDVVELIENNINFGISLNNYNWKLYDKYYTYPGAKNDHRTEMTTIYIYKK